MNNKSDWKYNLEYKNEDFRIISIIDFNNLKINPPIKNIKIIEKINYQQIEICFCKDYAKVEKICKDLKEICLCREKKFYFGNNCTFIFKNTYFKLEVIYYLEKLEGIYPLNILKKILFIKKIFLENENPYNYSKILKHIINPDVTLINFEILYQLDKEYHDNFINLLSYNKKLKILYNLPFHNKDNLFEYNYNLLRNLINTNIDINKLIKTIEFLTFERNYNYDKIFDDNNVYLQYLNYLSELAPLLQVKPVQATLAYNCFSL